MLVSWLLAAPGIALEPATTTGLSAADERLIAALPVVPPGLNQAYGLEVKRSKAILATSTLTAQTPNLTTNEWVLCVAKPVDQPSQTIGVAAGQPTCETLADQSPLRQPLLRVRVPVTDAQAAHETTLVIKTRAELFSRHLVSRHALSGPAKPAQLSQRERQLFLRRSRDFDYDLKEFQDWVAGNGLKREQTEGEVVFGRRAFQLIGRNFGYEYLGQQDRAASHVCAVGKSDCGGLSVLFATVMRSQGVPARTLAGRWAISAKPGDKLGGIEYVQQHVKAEFFANGVGWVPVDLSAAVLHDKSPEKLAYFGHDRGDFLTLHFDSDLVVDTVRFGLRTVNLLQNGAYWATGTGTLKDAELRQRWEIELLPEGTFR